MADWLPVVTAAGVQLLLFAYFVGGIRADIRAMKDEVAKLTEARIQTSQASGALGVQMALFAETKTKTDDNQTRLALAEAKLEEHDEKIDWGTRRFDEIFRSLAAVTKGDMPHVIKAP